jgi:hypothetical protein
MTARKYLELSKRAYWDNVFHEDKLLHIEVYLGSDDYPVRVFGPDEHEQATAFVEGLKSGRINLYERVRHW